MVSMQKVCVTYVAADCGSIIPGKSGAAAAFKAVKIHQKLLQAGIEVVENGPSGYHDTSPQLDVLEETMTYQPSPFVPHDIRNRADNLELLRKVRRRMTKNFDQEPNSFQLVLGGECCMLPVILSCVKRQYKSYDMDVGFIYVDADTDMHSPVDADWNGYFASMTMTQLMGRPGSLVNSNADSVLTNDKLCNAENTVFFGTNLSHPGNKNEHLAYLHGEHFKVFSLQAVALDPQARARDALEHLERKHKAIWVHLDVDSIDPGEFPLANVPNFTGVTFTNMMLALDVLLASESVIGLTVAEVNPDHDPGLVMTKRLTETIVAMLARKRSS